MRLRPRSLALALALTACLPTVASAAPPIPGPVGNVSDFADQLTPNEEARIEASIQELRDRDLWLAVAVIDRASPRTPKQWVHEAFNQWGVGSAGSDNGILVLLAVGDRRVELETGLGVEDTLTDAAAARLLQRHAVPHFKRGEMGEGLVELTAGISSFLLSRQGAESGASTGSQRTTPGAGAPGATPHRAAAAPRRFRRPIPYIPLVLPREMSLWMLGLTFLCGCVAILTGTRSFKDKRGRAVELVTSQAFLLLLAGGALSWVAEELSRDMGMSEVALLHVVVLVFLASALLWGLWSRLCPKCGWGFVIMGSAYPLRASTYEARGLEGCEADCVVCDHHETLSRELPKRIWILDLLGRAFWGVIRITAMVAVGIVLVALALGTLAFLFYGFPVFLLILISIAGGGSGGRSGYRSSSSWSSSSSSSFSSSSSSFGGGSSGGGGAGASW